MAVVGLPEVVVDYIRGQVEADFALSTLSKRPSVRFFSSPMIPLFMVWEGPIRSTVSWSSESFVNSAFSCSSGSSTRYPVTLGNSIRR